MDVAHTDNLTSIALVTMVALLCGLALIRLRQPAIVGYILAGVVLGPTGFKLISNTGTVQILAELGVIMLLFLIGMELSLRSFKAVYKTALLATLLQIALSFGAFLAVGRYLDWTMERITVFAFATALSSTAVAIKILEETDDLRTPVGRTTVSILIAQDLAVIPMLLVIGAFKISAGAPLLSIGMKLAGSVGFLAILSLFLSRRERLAIPLSDWILSRPEIMPLASMAFCFTLATLSGAVGLSTAYGAFVAGLIIGNSNVRAALHKASEPIQTILLMAFFLSIGLLIDLDYLTTHWRQVLSILALITLLKTLVNAGILRALGEPWHRALHSGSVLAQIGEFSFILCAAGLSAGALTKNGYQLMISVIALSLLISPMWLAISRRLHDMALGRLGGGIPPLPEDEF